VVAGARGHHAARARSLIERGERGQRAAQLERAGGLLGLELEVSVRAEQRSGDERRSPRVPANDRAGPLEIERVDAPARQAASAAT
jgi:hypothetical protein